MHITVCAVVRLVLINSPEGGDSCNRVREEGEEKRRGTAWERK